MKSLLISIKPKYCELIASGKKTIVIRRTKPKIETPFKCYIYCTLDGGIKGDRIVVDGKVGGAVCGKVIGEFVCDRVIKIEPFFTDDIKWFEKQSCLKSHEIVRYLNGFYGYGWHISNFKIYDKPRELSEFWAYNEELHERYDSERDFCCYDGTNEYGESLTDCGDAYNNILNCYRCWEEWSGWCHHVTRPPQSWCYVEELK